MKLVIASIAYDCSFINQDIFSVLELMGVVTTMITPFMFRKWIMPKIGAKATQLEVR